MTKRHAIGIINKTMGHNDLDGRRPMPLAAGQPLYLSCIKTGEKKTWEDIADAIGRKDRQIPKMVQTLNGLINN